MIQQSYTYYNSLSCLETTLGFYLYFIETHLQERNFQMNILLNVIFNFLQNMMVARFDFWLLFWSRSVIYQWWISDGSIARWHYLNFSYLPLLCGKLSSIYFLHFLRLIELIEIATVRKIKYKCCLSVCHWFAFSN